MSAPTRGLSWVPAPVPGTTDRYSVESQDSYDAADHYRLSLDYDQACEVARLLDEGSAVEERAALAEDLAATEQTLTDTESERDELHEEIETLKERIAELEAERKA